MIRRLGVVVALVTAAVVAGVATAAPGNAGTGASRPGPGATAASTSSADEVPWKYPACTSVTLSGVTWDAGADLFLATGSAAQCRSVVDLPGIANGYRVALYVPGEARGRAPGYNVRLFPAGDVVDIPHPFAAVATVPGVPGEYGVCAITTSWGRRKACLAVTVSTGPDGSPQAAVQPLAPDAPLVNRPLDIDSYTGTYGGGDIDPYCGGCF